MEDTHCVHVCVRVCTAVGALCTAVVGLLTCANPLPHPMIMVFVMSSTRSTHTVTCCRCSHRVLRSCIHTPISAMSPSVYTISRVVGSWHPLDPSPHYPTITYTVSVASLVSSGMYTIQRPPGKCHEYQMPRHCASIRMTATQCICEPLVGSAA